MWLQLVQPYFDSGRLEFDEISLGAPGESYHRTCWILIPKRCGSGGLNILHSFQDILDQKTVPSKSPLSLWRFKLISGGYHIEGDGRGTRQGKNGVEESIGMGEAEPLTTR